MKIDLTIVLPDGFKIYFGMPTEQTEQNEMFQLRHEVYAEEKGYRAKENSGFDTDEYDKKGACTYFIAKLDDQVIGTTRIIQDNLLPTEHEYFRFEEPEAIKNIPRNQRIEIGRIISRAYKKTGKNIPRNIVMISLFYVMTAYAKKNNLLGGYGSIKTYALKKFIKNRMPIHKISNAQLIFNIKDSSDPLSNFFTKNDLVAPVYYLTKEVSKYFDNIFNNGMMFERVNDNNYRLKKNKLGFFDKIKILLST